MDDRELLEKARIDYPDLPPHYSINDLFDRFERMLDDKEAGESDEQD